MNDESRLLLSIWEGIEDYLDSSDKQTVAHAIIKSFIDVGHDLEELYDVDGECPYIDRALTAAKVDEISDDIDDEEYSD